MSIVYHCDGCEKPIGAPIEKGHVTRRQYCEACAVKAEAFLEAEEALRKRLYEQFNAERQVLIDTCSENGFLLPDISA